MTAHDTDKLAGRTALITGGAHRIGATIARALHAQGMNLLIHYRHSDTAARDLKAELEQTRLQSVQLQRADLLRKGSAERLVQGCLKHWGRIDALINNASSFYPTPVGKIDEAQWLDLMGTNLKAPLFLSQAAATHLGKRQGNIVNLVDIHADRPLKQHTVYSVAKAGLVMLTKSLARELGPKVRVNAVAPGAILWPEQGLSSKAKKQIVEGTALKRHGHPDDIARAVVYLLRDADYMTGQVLTLDGGRSLRN